MGGSLSPTPPNLAGGSSNPESWAACYLPDSDPVSRGQQHAIIVLFLARQQSRRERPERKAAARFRAHVAIRPAQTAPPEARAPAPEPLRAVLCSAGVKSRRSGGPCRGKPGTGRRDRYLACDTRCGFAEVPRPQSRPATQVRASRIATRRAPSFTCRSAANQYLDCSGQQIRRLQPRRERRSLPISLLTGPSRPSHPTGSLCCCTNSPGSVQACGDSFACRATSMFRRTGAALK
jgi:hypothetical protein